MTKKLTGICLIFMILVSCNTQTKSKPMVVSTIGMIHNLVEEIAGNKVTAIGLMGPGIDPHLYKASAGDIKRLSDADLILYNGLHLESKLIDIFEKMNKKKPTKAITSSIPMKKLIQPDDYEGFYDPHVWFDVSLWQLAAKEVATALVALDPNNKETYKKNHDNYQQKLNELDQWIANQMDAIPTRNRLLVTAHDAFGYFSKKYNIRVVGLQGISTASEAGTKDIQHVANIIITHQVPTIFIESSVPVRQIEALKAAVHAKGWTVNIGEALFTDAMGDAGSIEGTYIGMMKHNVNSIVTGLRK